jgi:hypothetical protein
MSTESRQLRVCNLGDLGEPKELGDPTELRELREFKGHSNARAVTADEVYATDSIFLASVQSIAAVTSRQCYHRCLPGRVIGKPRCQPEPMQCQERGSVSFINRRWLFHVYRVSAIVCLQHSNMNFKAQPDQTPLRAPPARMRPARSPLASSAKFGKSVPAMHL